MTQETRLSRWSRMKAKSRPKGRGIFFKAPAPESDVEDPDADATEVASVTTQEPAQPESMDSPSDAVPAEVDAIDAEQEEPYPEDLPPIESLNKDSDFTAFMSDRISDKIRNAALRKLWLSNPALANLDGLLDYGEDLTSSFKTMENMQTTYVVGRGMVDYEAEAKRKAQEALEEKEAAALAQAETADDEAAESTEDPEDATGTENADEKAPETAQEAQDAKDADAAELSDSEPEAEEIQVVVEIDEKTPLGKA